MEMSKEVSSSSSSSISCCTVIIDLLEPHLQTVSIANRSRVVFKAISYMGICISLMDYSLLLQQCPACLVCLNWVIFGRWPYSCCFVGCCLRDLFNIARSKRDWSLNLIHTKLMSSTLATALRELSRLCKSERVHLKLCMHTGRMLQNYVAKHCYFEFSVFLLLGQL